MTCAAYSVDYGGVFLASASQTWTGSGRHEFEINLFGAGKSTPWRDYTVFCRMPSTYVTGPNGAYLHGVDLTEK